MKKSIFILSTVASMFLVSCGGSDEAKTAEGDVATEQEAPEEEEEPAEVSIVGVWKMTDMDMGMEIPKGKEKEFEDMMKEMAAKTAYTFKDDGTIDIKSPAANSNGTYTYADGKLTTVVMGKTETIAVPTLTEDQMVIEVEDRGTKMSMTFKRS